MKILELSLKVKGFDIGIATQDIIAVQNLNETQFNIWRNTQRDSIVKYHQLNNPLYQSLIKGKVIDVFEDLPVLNKYNYQNGLKANISKTFKTNNLYSGSTSGSSGHPFYFAKDKYAHARTHALIMNRYNQHGISVDDKQARFFGIPLKGTSRYKELMKDKLANRIRFPVFDLSDRQLEVFLKRFYKIRFEYIYGYTSAIVLFAKFIIRKGIVLNKICPTLRFCIVTSEVCTVEDKTTIEKALGVKVLNEYGASELDVMAFTNPDGEWELSQENVYFEVVDNLGKVLPFGEEGRILVTSLFNKAMPIIRYEIGDLGIINKKGQRLILEKLTGRVNDIAKLPSGKLVPGLTFYYVAKSILEQSDAIKEFIIKQTKPDTFIFEMVSDRDITPDERKMIKSQMDIYLESGLNMIINRLDKIERPNSGKIKHFYSNL